MAVSWLSIIAVMVGVFIVAKVLAHSGGRSVLAGLGALAAVAFVFLFFVRHATVDRSIAQFQTEHARTMAQAREEAARAMARARDEQARAMAQAHREMAQAQQEAAREMTRATEEQAQAIRSQGEARTIAGPPLPPRPPKPSADLAKHPQPGIVAALATALRKAWIDRAPAAKKPASPPTKEPATTAVALSAPTSPQKPAWIDAPAKLEGDVYLMGRQIGPYTTLLECERELPKTLQSAASEYADLLLGEKAGDMNLPDDYLLKLVRERWPEHLTQEFGGAAQDMVILHVLIGFDRPAQEEIRAASEHALVDRRMQRAGAALGGLLGLLALAWGGLSLFGREREPKPRQETTTRTPPRNRTLPVLVALAIALAVALLLLVGH